MDFGLSAEQVLFKKTLRRFFETECPTSRVRAIMESDSGHDPELWAKLVDLGVTGLIVPPEQGGSGLELLDLALAAEELGYAAAPGPFLGNALGTVALKEAGASGAPWLPRIASGEVLATVAIGEDESEWEPQRLKARVDSGRLRARKPFVPYAAQADLILVAAHDQEGPGLFAVERGARGVTIEPVSGVDMTRRVHRVAFEDTPAHRIAGPEALSRTIDAGLILVAADAYGGMRRCFEMALNYAKQREQFGQVIGAFQAVKHQLADLITEIEPALSLWWYAAHAFDHIADQCARHAALAKAHLTDLFDRVARDATELHGGIGFTWEYDLHLWFRRAMFDRSFLGDASYHRARAADLAGW